MSDILIKGMELPKSCEECALYDEDYGECRRETDLLRRTITRENGCPLVEVKEAEFGDLYEVSKVYVKAYMTGKKVWMEVNNE